MLFIVNTVHVCLIYQLLPYTFGLLRQMGTFSRCDDFDSAFIVWGTYIFPRCIAILTLKWQMPNILAWFGSIFHQRGVLVLSFLLDEG